MTYKDKVLLEHPEAADDTKPGDVKGCPSTYGYDNEPKCAGNERHYAWPANCRACWNREFPEEKPMSINEVVSVLARCDTSSAEDITHPHILDSGNRREFGTGAVRDIQEGKGRCDLLPLDVASKVIPYHTHQCSVLIAIHHFQNSGDADALYKAIEIFGEYHFKNRYTMLLEVSKHFEEGAKKYGPDNWQKGIPTKCYIDSAVRHYLKWLRGDKDEPHDRAFVWNLMCCIWTCEHKPELNTYAGDNNN